MAYTNTIAGNTGRGAWDHTSANLTINCDIRDGYENQNCVGSTGARTVGVRAKNPAGESFWRYSTAISPPED